MPSLLPLPVIAIAKMRLCQWSSHLNTLRGNTHRPLHLEEETSLSTWCLQAAWLSKLEHVTTFKGIFVPGCLPYGLLSIALDVDEYRVEGMVEGRMLTRSRQAFWRVSLQRIRCKHSAFFAPSTLFSSFSPLQLFIKASNDESHSLSITALSRSLSAS